MATPVTAAATDLRPVGLFVLATERQVQLRKAVVALPAMLAGPTMLETLGALLPTRASFEHLLLPAAGTAHDLEVGGNYLFLGGAWVSLKSALPVGVSVGATISVLGVGQVGSPIVGSRGGASAPVMVGAGGYASHGYLSEQDTEAAQQDEQEDEDEHDFVIEKHNRRSFYNMTSSHVFEQDQIHLRRHFDRARNQEQVQELIDYVAQELKDRPRLYPTGGREVYLKANGYPAGYKGALRR